MCSGKVFYTLQQARRAKKAEPHVSLVRLEQLLPFPHEALAQRLARYPNAELVWCQEEPKNMGFWAFVQPRVQTALRELGGLGGGGGGGGGGSASSGGGGSSGSSCGVRDVRYVGRPAAASPATGSPSIHAAETKALIAAALGVSDGGEEEEE